MKRLLVGVTGVVLIAFAALLVAVEAGAPIGGITHSQATVAARDAIYGSPVTERWALPGPFLFFRGGSTDAVSPWGRMVWAVSFSGTFLPASCGPMPAPGQVAHCPPAVHTVTVIVDYVTGDFIQADYPGL